MGPPQYELVGGSANADRTCPADLWTDVWLALVAFVAERIGTREWAPDAASVDMALDAAWDAISAGHATADRS